MSEEKVYEVLTDFATAVEAAAVQLKQAIAAIVKVKPSLSEEPFLGLKWQKAQGARLKEYEFTTKAANDNSDTFNRCMNILKANQATISKRFHDEGWVHSYWLYSSKPDTIYRQALKPT